MNSESMLRVLPNGAHVLASQLIDDRYLVLAWRGNGRGYVSWRVNPSNFSAYRGHCSDCFKDACERYEFRRGERGVPLQDMLDAGDNPSCENLDAWFRSHLELVANDITRPVFYRDYADHKACAIDAKDSGDIENAMREENVCQYIYESMPEGFRW